MKTAYLIYYHDLDSYEGYDAPFAIVNSKKRAEKIRQDIIQHGELLAEQMLYPHEDGISDEEYWSRDSKNRKLVNSPWPHDWQSHSYSVFKRTYGYGDGPEKMRFATETVAIKELPLL